MEGRLTMKMIRIGAMSWQLSDGVPAVALFDADGFRLPRWLASGEASSVKERSHRGVWHVTLPGLDFYLKHDRPVKTSLLHKIARTGSVRSEFELGRELARRGVPTPEPLAFGERISGSAEGFLLTRTLPESVPLDLFLESSLALFPPHRQTQVRQQIALALGRLLALLHDAGVTHRDLHPGNLLLQFGADGVPRLSLIDLHAVRLGAPLSRSAGLANLVILNRWFILRSERTDRQRCWQAYIAARQVGCTFSTAVVNAPLLCRQLERGTLHSNLAFWRNRDRRCRTTNRYFRTVRQGDVKGYAVADLPADALTPFLAEPDAAFAQAGVKLLKNSPSSTVAEMELPVNGGTLSVVYKRFAVTKGTDPWVALARPTAALRSWVSGHALISRLLPTPRPLVVLHRFRHGLAYEGYLLTEKVSNALEPGAYLERLAGIGNSATRTRDLLDRVGRLLRRLHDRHLSHRDLKAPNLLLQLASDGLTVENIFFIDLVGVRRHGKLRRPRRVQNLTRLHASFRNNPAVTRTDKLRFLRAYLAWGLYGRLGWKRWWRQIEAATEAKVIKNRRNGRPLK
jgi:tRNA A-37 threonylcarbamoyl transferase component Bud32